LATFDTFYVDLYIDGTFLQRWYNNQVIPPGYYVSIKDYNVGPLAPGPHTLELVPDSTNTIGSSNNLTKRFTIAQAGPPLKPTTSTSWYVKAIGPYQRDSALYAWALQAGQQAGQLNETAGKGTFVILDFGAPWKSSSGSISAASGFGRKGGLTVTEVSNVVKQFVLGYESATQLELFLAVGTSNSGLYVSKAHAQVWAKMLLDLDEWITSKGFGVDLSSANDAELSYNSPQTTKAWFQAFNDEIAKNGPNNSRYKNPTELPERLDSERYRRPACIVHSANIQ